MPAGSGETAPESRQDGDSHRTGSKIWDRQTVSTSWQPPLGNPSCSSLESSTPFIMPRDTRLDIGIEHRRRTHLTHDARATLSCSCAIAGYSGSCPLCPCSANSRHHERDLVHLLKGQVNHGWAGLCLPLV